MKRLFGTVVLVAAIAALTAAPRLGAQNAPKRAMSVADVVAFKSLGVTTLSPDGAWLAYRQSPQEGDSDVIVRSTSSDKSWTFAVGQSGGAVTFSDDSAWVGITTSATKREADAARRASRPAAPAGVTLLNLSTGEKTAIPKIRRFAFDGELGGWVALHRAPADAAAGRGAAPAAGRAGGPAGAPAPSTAPRGTDLLLHDLKTGVELNVGNVSDFAFNKSGKLLALVIDAADQVGNGVELRDMTTGAITPFDMDKAFFDHLAWTTDGDALTVMRGHDDRAYKERQYAIDGFTGLNAGAATSKKVVIDPSKLEAFPKGMAISANRAARWTDARDAIVFGIASLTKVERPAGARGAGTGEDAADAPAGGAGAGGAEASTPDPADRPDLIIWHYKDPRLQSQQQVQAGADGLYTYLSTYRVADGKFVRLADDEVRTVSLLDKDTFAIGNDTRAYELDGNITGRNFSDVYQIDATTGARKLVKKQVRWPEGGSPDGTHWAYYENRNVFVVDLKTGTSKNITQGQPFSVVDTEDDHNVVDQPRAAVGWTSNSSAMLLTDGWDIWKVPVDGSPAVNLTVNGKKDSIRYRGHVRIDPDEKGIDLSKPQYFNAMAEWTKKQGYVLLAPGKTGVTPLLWDDATFGRLAKAKKGDVWIYSRETPMTAPDVYATNAHLENGRALTHSQAEVDPFLWTPGSQLIDFTNVKGERLQASLHLPANYEKGKQYPTIVYIYERLTQGHDSFPRPSVPGTGFNIASTRATAMRCSSRTSSTT